MPVQKRAGRNGASEQAPGVGEEAQLRALYTQVDALLADYTCPQSTECCRFAVNNREPYVTSLEMAVVGRALGALGGAKAVLSANTSKKRLPVSSAAAHGRDANSAAAHGRDANSAELAEREGRCPLLGKDDRCRIYASRPFGCRTFFCERIEGGKLPRAAISQLTRALDDLAQAYDPISPKGRPFRGALATLAVQGAQGARR